MHTTVVAEEDETTNEASICSFQLPTVLQLKLPFQSLHFFAVMNNVSMLLASTTNGITTAITYYMPLQSHHKFKIKPSNNDSQVIIYNYALQNIEASGSFT